MDSRVALDDNLLVLGPEVCRKRIARTLATAYADGLLSEETFAERVDQLLKAPLVRPKGLIGDLALRHSNPRISSRLRDAARAMLRQIAMFVDDQPQQQPALLALDWSGKQEELLVGRDTWCDVVLEDPAVSRQHAWLVFRASRWIIQDLKSRNGTILNGVRVGRSELRPGDRLVLGHELLQVD